jgi:hypothetical protein
MASGNHETVDQTDDSEGPQDDRSERELTQRAWASFAELSDQPETVDVLLEAFERELSGEITGETFINVRDGAGTLMSEEAFAYLAYLTRRSFPTRRRDLAESDAPPEAVALVRMILALYGTRLARAFALWPETGLRHDWQAFTRRIFHDVEAKEYVVHLAVRKKNGELVKVEGPLDSIVRLAQRIMATINEVKDREALDEEDAAELLEELDRFKDIIAPSP